MVKNIHTIIEYISPEARSEIDNMVELLFPMTLESVRSKLDIKDLATFNSVRNVWVAQLTEIGRLQTDLIKQGECKVDPPAILSLVDKIEELEAQIVSRTKVLAKIIKKVKGSRALALEKRKKYLIKRRKKLGI